MALADIDASRTGGQPVELYLFRYGTETDAYHAFCDGVEDVTHLGITYTPAPVKRDRIGASQSLDKQEMKVTVDLNNPVAELFRVYPPSDVVSLTVRRGHVGNADFAVIWVGRILSVSRTKRIAELTAIPSSISIRRPGLRRHYQLTCPHVLFDQDPGSCKADRTAATVPAVSVSALTYTSVTLPAAWFGALAPIKFIGGIVAWDGDSGRERRTILRVSVDGLTLTLSAPTTGLAVASEVDVELGCNHQITDCEELHDNILNFGGMPYIPQENPVKSNPFT